MYKPRRNSLVLLSRRRSQRNSPRIKKPLKNSSSRKPRRNSHFLRRKSYHPWRRRLLQRKGCLHKKDCFRKRACLHKKGYLHKKDYLRNDDPARFGTRRSGSLQLTTTHRAETREGLRLFSHYSSAVKPLTPYSFIPENVVVDERQSTN